jgi:hypothetical protein
MRPGCRHEEDPMNKRRLEHPRHDDYRQNDNVATLLMVGGAGILFLVGVGAAYSLALASGGALATMATALVTVGLAGLLVVAGVVAIRRPLPGRDGQGGTGGGRPALVPIRPGREPDAELSRILDDVRFGDLNLRRPAPLRDRRGTA